MRLSLPDCGLENIWAVSMFCKICLKQFWLEFQGVVPLLGGYLCISLSYNLPFSRELYVTPLDGPVVRTFMLSIKIYSLFWQLNYSNTRTVHEQDSHITVNNIFVFLGHMTLISGSHKLYNYQKSQYEASLQLH